ncbi:MAG: sulfatase [Planctomycetota bacterium]
MSYVSFLLYSCAASAILTLPARGQAEPPNVIVFFADDLGWSDLSGGNTNYDNGSTFYRTPNIDALASQGLSFSSAYAQQNCSPTRSALLTGQYAPTNGNHNVDGLNRAGNGTLLRGPSDGEGILGSTFTIAEALQNTGYTTAHIGKFHSTDSANQITNQHGFDFNYGGGTSGSPGPQTPYFAFQNKGNWVFGDRHGPQLDAYADPYTQAYIDVNLTPYATTNNPDTLLGTPKHLNDAMADAAIDFIASKTGGEPFFIHLAFNAVHTQIKARPDLEAAYNESASTDSRHDSEAYAGLLEGMDQAIGRVTNFIDSQGLGDNTLILFYSDNGGHEGPTKNSPLRGRKGTLREGGVRVPLIARMPGTIDANTISDEAVHAVDLYPTIATMAGASLPDQSINPINGESLAGILTGDQTQLQRDAIYWHFPGYLDSRAVPTSVTTRDVGNERYKLYYFYEIDTYELYNLTADLSESTDLLAGSANDVQFQIATQMAQDLRVWLDSQGAIYPTVRSSGAAVKAPSGRTSVQFSFDLSSPSFDGESIGSLTQRGVTLSLEAIGSNAIFDGNTGGVGVNSNQDSGDASVQRRIDGSLTTPESIRFLFDRDVVLESLLLGALSTISGNETVNLTFVSGDNPFIGLSGYNAGDFTLTSDSLSFTTTSGASTPFLLEFGVLNRDDLILTEGTVLELTSNPATSGGILLNQINVKNYLSLIEGDLDLDNDVDEDDLNMLLAQWGSVALPGSRVDGDTTGDGLVNQNDLDVMFANWTTGEPPNIPEPGTLTLMALSGLFALRRQRA